MQWLAQAVRDHSPLQFKFEFGLWTLSLIAALIERQFGKKLALSGVSRIMKLLGFTAQKPLYQAWQQDATLVRQWEFETYPAIRTEARKVGATIYFADESGIRSDYHTGTTWAPQGLHTGGGSDRQALFAEHDFGGRSSRRVPVHGA